ncbi:MAG: hypothetical protein KDA88_21605 [Planctomycetaceae bacterium]|nr:hypothetical protein [Planctomycetaceae bacterium]MCB9951425.1 hypothetical protein [Planctomycetaceae bacterium]
MIDRKFINLNRQFVPITSDQSFEDSFEHRLSSGLGNRVSWDDLLQKRRVVILAEAGAGKTEEMLETCRRLRRNGQTSFFIRLEHLAVGLEDSFDEGDVTEFNDWRDSEGDAWFFLDSVDEARLCGPKDFEKAIRRFASAIEQRKSQCKVFISSRITEWRPDSDFKLISQRLALPEERHRSQPDGVLSASPGEFDDRPQATDDTGDLNAKTPEIFGLLPLDESQIAKFCEEWGLDRFEKFIDQAKRHDTLGFASRPLDLIELIDFWNSNGRIGSRYELVSHSVTTRLKERDPDRAHQRNLSSERAYNGAMAVAAAVTLTKDSRIRVPGATAEKCVDVREVLKNWSAAECAALLERPIFDNAIYGTVRFHHRVVREFLTAEWIVKLLQRKRRRSQIGKLFFRRQYGCDVVVPTMRSIIGWVAIHDEEIRDRAIEVSPDVLIEFGDASLLPLPSRTQILEAYCNQLANHHDRWSIDRAALIRFSHPDLVPSIRDLLHKYRKHSEVLDTLLLLIQHGVLKELLPEVMDICKADRIEEYTRVFAIRAMAAIGTSDDRMHCVESLLKPERVLEGAVFAELVRSFGPEVMNVVQVTGMLSRFSFPDGPLSWNLALALEEYALQSDHEDCPTFVGSLVKLLKQEPYCNDHCRISKEYDWLVKSMMRATEKLLREKHDSALQDSIVDFVALFCEYEQYGSGGHVEHELKTLIADFEAFNRKLFWRTVEYARAKATGSGRRIQYSWQVRQVNPYWQFDAAQFSKIVTEIGDRTLADDKLMALSLAFDLYRQADRPRSWYRKLRTAVNGDPELHQRLQEFFHPQPISEVEKGFRKQEAQFKRQRIAHEESEKKRNAEWRDYLARNVEKLCDVSTARDGEVQKGQWYLLEELRRNQRNRSRWGLGHWRELIPQHGIDVATAFKDGLTNYWRHYKPKIRSEGIKNPNSVPWAISVALSGINIEFQEFPHWPENISQQEAVLAVRLALWEMNGFPDWLPRLYKRFPKVVEELILQEVEWELNSSSPNENQSYVIHDIRWHGEWMFEAIAERLLSMIHKEEPIALSCLSDCLWIIQRSESVTKEQIRRTAKHRIEANDEVSRKAIWFAVWIDADCDVALDELEHFVEKFVDSVEADQFVLHLLTCLQGDSFRDFRAHRQSFRSAEALNRLYLIAMRHVRREDDIDRVGKGAYSPTERDRAQDARNALYNILCQTPGKASYLALLGLAERFGDERPWIRQQARMRATVDADFPPWSIQNFHTFAEAFEHAPNSHSELYELTLDRIDDLKHDLEQGDSSIASILSRAESETEFRKFIGGWLRDRACGLYSVPQEEELADTKRPDVRIHASNIDGPVPVELKIADNWSASELFERLENQLIGDYLRDRRSNCGVYLLFSRGTKSYWQYKSKRLKFQDLILELQSFGDAILEAKPEIEAIKVVGIDLGQRGKRQES